MTIEILTAERVKELFASQRQLLQSLGVHPQPFLRITEERLREIVRDELGRDRLRAQQRQLISLSKALGIDPPEWDEPFPILPSTS